MRPKDLLFARRAHLERVVRSSLEGARPHSLGFARRILGREDVDDDDGTSAQASSVVLDRARYGGYPEVARVGFFLGGRLRSDIADTFLDDYLAVLERFSKRAGAGVSEFAQDDVAVLGVADGVSRIVSWEMQDAPRLRDWLLDLVDGNRASGAWSARARDLAADLLDGRGRVRVKVGRASPDEGALDLCLREAWPQAFLGAPFPDEGVRQKLLERLLQDCTPDVGDLERASIWLRSLDLLVRQASQSMVTSASDVVRLLENTQSAMKRWVWEKSARRRDADPARWLIDNEYHVQSLLWAVLYPIFGSDLRDEEYLVGYGLKQPRADIVIVGLKLVVEVKFARNRRDFAEIEEQVAGDLGLYFEDPERVSRLVVYVYDDCDTQYPEQYDTLKNALRARDRVDDVVIVRRPGMLPPSKERRTVT